MSMLLPPFELHEPTSIKEAIDLMMEQPNLIKRPDRATGHQ